jgi:2-polyprenyl-3-methyl-5-hydroxy-6-metoxy-1,4-benzoquinol methylase
MSRTNASFDYSRQIYQTYGSDFLTISDYQAWARNMHLRLRDWLPQERHIPILDMGCGAGQFLYLMNSRGYTEITGVDLSPARVDQAQAAVPQARVIQGDLREILSANPGRFGLITGFDVIEHFPKEEVLPLLILVAQALRRGGRVIVQTPNGDSPWLGAIAFGDFTHEWIPTPKSLAGLMGQAGLVDFVARECGPAVHGFKSAVRFLLWQVMRSLLIFFNLVEMGHRGSGIYSRVFVATACREPFDKAGDKKQ